MGSTTRVVIAQLPRQTMVLESGIQLERPVMILYDGSPNSQRALSTALNLQTEGNPILIILLTEDAEQAQQWQSEIQAQLTSSHPPIHYYWFPKLGTKRIAQLAQLERCSVFIVPAQSERIGEEDLLSILNTIECAVLLVR